MTDDEMQALREVEGCGAELDTVARSPQGERVKLYHDRAVEWIGTIFLGECDACLRLLADAVVRQRVERMSTSKCVALGFTLFEGRDDTDKYKAALLAALTGENTLGKSARDYLRRTGGVEASPEAQDERVRDAIDRLEGTA